MSDQHGRESGCTHTGPEREETVHREKKVKLRLSSLGELNDYRATYEGSSEEAVPTKEPNGGKTACS
jgi:hypothetical protein